MTAPDTSLLPRLMRTLSVATVMMASTVTGMSPRPLRSEDTANDDRRPNEVPIASC